MKLKIGDKIKIIAPGQIYSTFKDMAKLLGADVGGKWQPRSVSEGDYSFKEKGYILNMSDGGHHILIELDSGRQWIISPDGLKKIYVILPEELFEI